MSTWLRFALSCVLALALPLQGVAAATLLHCGASQPAAAPMQHHDHTHHAMAVAGHAHDAASPAAAARPKCSVCSSCCVATAPLAATPAFDATTPVESYDPIGGPAAPVFLTGGPERPPRPSLA